MMEREKRDPNSAARAGKAVWKALNSPRLALALILLLALASRILALQSHRLRTDSTEYLALARDVARGEYFQSHYPLDEGILWSRRLVPAPTSASCRATISTATRSHRRCSPRPILLIRTFSGP